MICYYNCITNDVSIVNVEHFYRKEEIMAKAKSDNGEPVMLNRDEAAEKLSIVTNYVATVAKKDPTLAAGVVVDVYPGSKIKRWRISEEACDAYLAAQRANGGTARAARGNKRYATVVIAPEQRDQINAYLESIGVAPLGPIWIRPTKDAGASTNETNGTSDDATSDNDSQDQESEYSDYEGVSA